VRGLRKPAPLPRVAVPLLVRVCPGVLGQKDAPFFPGCWRLATVAGIRVRVLVDESPRTSLFAQPNQVPSFGLSSGCLASADGSRRSEFQLAIHPISRLGVQPPVSARLQVPKPFHPIHVRQSTAPVSVLYTRTQPTPGSAEPLPDAFRSPPPRACGPDTSKANASDCCKEWSPGIPIFNLTLPPQTSRLSRPLLPPAIFHLPFLSASFPSLMFSGPPTFLRPT
jgi:hypothetical protein